MSRRRVFERFQLLCQSGATFESLAPALCDALHDIIDTKANAVFWVSHDGMPAGYYHDDAPAEIKDFYLANFDELFVVPGQFTMIEMLGPRVPSVGSLLAKGQMEWVLESNIHKYLCEPLGHHHAIDMRIDHDRRGAAVFALWRGPDHPYDMSDVRALRPLQPVIEQVFARPAVSQIWRSAGARTAHFTTDIEGRHLKTIDAAAERILSESHLLRQNIPARPPLQAAPGFARQLAMQLGDSESTTMTIPVAGGRLLLRASRTRVVTQQEGGAADMFVGVEKQVCVQVLAAEYAADLSLSFMQKRIVMFALLGGARNDCAHQLGVGAEALKKHLRAIYQETGVADWAELAGIAEGLS